jgi:NDP-sugar pyrophosphorylase family protein
MKAMILAAGLGTRLKPLTNTIPKALIPLNQKTILEHLIVHLKQSGITEIIINLHHFPEKIAEFLKAHHNFDIHIEVSYEENLLDTGGGLKKARWFLDDGKPFLLHNVDVVSNLNLDQMLRYHLHKNGLATLAVRARNTSRYLLFDPHDRLAGWEDLDLRQKKLVTPAGTAVRPCSFMGIHIISADIFTRLPAAEKFSIITAYLDMAAEKNSIYAFYADAYTWSDLGRLQSLQAAEQDAELLNSW